MTFLTKLEDGSLYYNIWVLNLWVATLGCCQMIFVIKFIFIRNYLIKLYNKNSQNLFILI